MKYLISGMEAYLSSVFGIINILTSKEVDLTKRSFAEKVKQSTYEI